MYMIGTIICIIVTCIAPSPGFQIFSCIIYAQEKRESLVSEVIYFQTWATKTTSILKSNKLRELTEKNKGAITVNSSIHAFLGDNKPI